MEKKATQKESNSGIQKILEEKNKFLETENQALKDRITNLESFILQNPQQFPEGLDFSSNFEFEWENCSNSSLLKNKKIARKNQKDSLWNCTILGNRTINKDCMASWKIKIISSEDVKIILGIAKKGIDRNNQDNINKDTWALAYTSEEGFIIFDGGCGDNSCHEVKGPVCKNGTIVEIKALISKMELNFTADGEEIGTFKLKNIDITAEYVPYVEMSNFGDEVELV